MSNIKPLFELGRVLITPGARDVICERYPEARTATNALLLRHVRGDWREMEKEDQKANRDAVRDGERVFSRYTLRTLPGEAEAERVWVITEWDRSYTTILLPSEY